MKALVIEDDPEIVEAVSLCFELRWPDANVLHASEGRLGVELVEMESPDIVILDIGLPDIDGFETCRQIRLFSDVPIIILSVRDQEMDIVKGLEVGADDYLNKPFSSVELLARTKAVLRRAQPLASQNIEPYYAYGDTIIDLANREIRRENRSTQLTPTECKILEPLIRNAGLVVTYSLLAEAIWGRDYPNSTESIKVHIRRLRVKIEADHKNPELILNKAGVGYIMPRPSYPEAE